ncbi:hypothetical protein ACFRCI_34495 [Streptomyces sp. NPDC056638]|uniref:hypothetical protein n=1 Tax=Streptomyces sp. NPDC056638 TaxID=3345887 RepID=UPI0036CC1D3D
MRQFAAMVDDCDATPLPAWLDELANSGHAPLAGIASALHADQNAVVQGITTPYTAACSRSGSSRWARSRFCSS